MSLHTASLRRTPYAALGIFFGLCTHFLMEVEIQSMGNVCLRDCYLVGVALGVSQGGIHTIIIWRVWLQVCNWVIIITPSYICLGRHPVTVIFTDMVPSASNKNIYLKQHTYGVLPSELSMRHMLLCPCGHILCVRFLYALKFQGYAILYPWLFGGGGLLSIIWWACLQVICLGDDCGP